MYNHRWLMRLCLSGFLVFAQVLPTFAAILSAPLPQTAANQNAFRGQSVVARVYFADQAELNRLAAELDIWEVHHSRQAADRYFVALLTASQLTQLQQAGHRVVIDPVKTQRLHLTPVMAAGQESGIPGFACYRTVEETYTSLAQLAQNYPNLATWKKIGQSWNLAKAGNGTGYDLQVLVLTNQAKTGPKSNFFLMGAIHARELTTAESVTRFAEYLVNNYGRDANVTWLLDYNAIHLLPITNPDGRKQAEKLLYWRKNVDPNLERPDHCTSDNPVVPGLPYYGVDLNRNYNFKWNGCKDAVCSSDNTCSEIFRGTGAASEPETQAVQDYLQTLFPDRRESDDEDAAPLDTGGLVISLHSYSELVLFPWGWRPSASPNSAQLQTLGNKFGYFTGYQACQAGAPGCIYQTDGSTDDWAYGTLGVAAYTFELGTDFFESCNFFEESLYPSLTLPALLYAAKAARLPYQTPSGPESLQVVVTPTQVLSGTVVTLKALADDTRHNGHNLAFEPSQPISAAHYSVDAPAWITGTNTFSLTVQDGQFDTPREAVTAQIDTTGWAPGRHLLLVESQDADGHWGVPGGVFLEIATALYGVALAKPGQTGRISPNGRVAYTLSITNTGMVSDTFAVHIGPSPWPVTAPLQIGPLAPFNSAPLAVTIAAPPTATLGLSNTVMITVTSQSSPTIQASQTLTTEVTNALFYFPIVTRP